MDLIEALADDPRIAVRNGAPIDPRGRCVIYWMRRAQRAFDNPALETAIAIANAIEKPVVVFFALRTHHPYANVRHYTFMIEGLADTAARIERRRVGFAMRLPRADAQWTISSARARRCSLRRLSSIEIRSA